MENTKICLVNNTGSYLFRFRKEIILSYLESGIAVLAIFPFDGFENDLTNMGVECIHIPIDSHSLNPISEFKIVYQFFRIIKANSPDKIFAFTLKPIFYSSLVASLLKIPCFSMVTGLGRVYAKNPEKFSPLRIVANSIYKFSFRSNRNVFFQNADNIKDFVSKGIIAQKKVVRIHGSGVNLRDYPYAVRSFESNTLEFLMAARLFHEKGICEYCIASARMLEKYPVKCTVVGDLPENSDILIDNKDFLSFAKIAGINFEGVKSSLSRNFESAHVFVLPSHGGEGIPRVILEALSTGLPLITTDTPGCRETISKNGILVQAQSPNQLFEAMEKLYVSRKNLESMSRRSRFLAESIYDVKDVVDTIRNCVDADDTSITME